MRFDSGQSSPGGGLTMGNVGTVRIVKVVSLSPRVENLKVKKVINVSYLNNRVSSVFRIPHAYVYVTMKTGCFQLSETQLYLA